MRILVALSRFPWPLEKGDKLRAWYQLQGLAQRHEVHLVCLNERAVPAQDMAQLDFCASVQVIRQGRLSAGLNLLAGLFSPIPFQVHYFRSARMRRVLARTIQRHHIETCYVQLIRLGESLPLDAFTDLHWVLDYMDTFSIGMRQRIAETGFLMRRFVAAEARRLQAYETSIAAKFDELVIISERDAEGLDPLLREDVHVIPNGVGESFFEELPRPSQQDFDLIFFGNMGYHPNVQSARFLVEEVLPILHGRGLHPRLCIAGARPAAVIRSWEGADITVTGFVADIREYVLRSKVAVAPLVGGQGLQNKLLESMALRTPTVTSRLGNAGLGACAGQDLIVCDSATDFADAIQDLLFHPDKASHIAANGRKFVETHFRWTAMNARLEQVLLRIRAHQP